MPHGYITVDYDHMPTQTEIQQDLQCLLGGDYDREGCAFYDRYGRALEGDSRSEVAVACLNDALMGPDTTDNLLPEIDIKNITKELLHALPSVPLIAPHEGYDRFNNAEVYSAQNAKILVAYGEPIAAVEDNSCTILKKGGLSNTEKMFFKEFIINHTDMGDALFDVPQVKAPAHQAVTPAAKAALFENTSSINR